MSTDRHTEQTDTVAQLAAVGITVTDAGRARARRRLAAAADKLTPEHLETWRRQIGADAA